MKKFAEPLKNKFISQVFRPLQEFVRLESTSGLLLFICTVIALILANSSLSQTYFSLLNSEFSLGFERVALKETILHWINDGLMCLFFFVVGLEIKRELLIGELAGIKRAMLPVIAALGGMIVPAGIYILLNNGTESLSGWGIPMATDIAFSLGVLTIMGSRLPNQLKIFLTAFAIVDDLGAVLVIAFFYGANIHWFFLFASMFIFLLLLIANFIGIRNLLHYTVLGILLWFTVLESGVHATIAGVLLAMTIPARINNNLEKTPLQRFEHKLHPWVTYAVMPVFALANAGVSVEGNSNSLLGAPVVLGIVLGLVIGKQFGITLFSWIAVKIKLAALPSGVSWKHIYGVSWLGGIGFTMSLFIATLAFNQEILLNQSKLAILMASLIAGMMGSCILFIISRKQSLTQDNFE
jgi:Na+:H+ antiporter, NhaA family